MILVPSSASCRRHAFGVTRRLRRLGLRASDRAREGLRAEAARARFAGLLEVTL